MDKMGRVELGSDMRNKEERCRGMREEWQEVRNVSEDILKVHGVALGSKAEEITRLLYENANGIQCKWSNNWKVEKACELHDELEVDIVAYNEHRLNMKHKSNSVGFRKLFGGGEADMRSIVAHNFHENIGRVQEGGTSMLMFGPLIEYLDMSEGGKDVKGLGCWVVMTLKGGNGTIMRIVCRYNPCGNDKPNSSMVYQQHWQSFINKENLLHCPWVKFREDLMAQLMRWREEQNV